MTVKELRTQLKLSQIEMAKALGVTTGSIQHLERGRMKLSQIMAERIKDVFSIDITENEPVSSQPAKKPDQVVKAAAQNTPLTDNIVIQSPLGGEISMKEILRKIPKNADKVYVRVDQNKLWWVCGEETGSVDIW